MKILNADRRRSSKIEITDKLGYYAERWVSKYFLNIPSRYRELESFLDKNIVIVSYE